MHPFMVSYGFEDYDRLTEKFEIPHELISRTSGDLLCFLPGMQEIRLCTSYRMDGKALDLAQTTARKSPQ